MSFTTRAPRVPMPPLGETVASYATYLEAQRAVDHLAEKSFPVTDVSIVGTDLKMVERVTGKLSYPRAALGGFMTGAWFGLFVGLLLSLFSTPGSGSPFLSAIVIGGAFGALFSLITYSITRRRRDFTSTSQIVASTYAVLCRTETAHKARGLLAEIGAVQPAPTQVARPPVAVPQGPPAYGVRGPASPPSAPDVQGPPAYGVRDSTPPSSAPATALPEPVGTPSGASDRPVPDEPPAYGVRGPVPPTTSSPTPPPVPPTRPAGRGLDEPPAYGVRGPVPPTTPTAASRGRASKPGKPGKPGKTAIPVGPAAPDEPPAYGVRTAPPATDEPGNNTPKPPAPPA